ncbi:hypothetical protein ACTWQB_16735 [Piscibacillus sp. B03]|uniref:hypothetical protein n=1 Tax=Piscibacillus sp. B03 TaxID=3457430 RepID=UPI003FCE9387
MSFILWLHYFILCWTEHLIMSQMLTMIQNIELQHIKEQLAERTRLEKGQELLLLPEPAEEFYVSEVEDDELIAALTGALNDGEDTLSIEDIEEYPEETLAPVEHDVIHTKISDEREGLQIWQGRVVGVEFEYIHFYDGSRTWLRVEDISSFEHNDIIEILVNRQDDDVEVIHVRDVFRVHETFKIPDEESYAV